MLFYPESILSGDLFWLLGHLLWIQSSIWGNGKHCNLVTALTFLKSVQRPCASSAFEASRPSWTPGTVTGNSSFSTRTINTKCPCMGKAWVSACWSSSLCKSQKQAVRLKKKTTNTHTNTHLWIRLSSSFLGAVCFFNTCIWKLIMDQEEITNTCVQSGALPPCLHWLLLPLLITADRRGGGRWGRVTHPHVWWSIIILDCNMRWCSELESFKLCSSMSPSVSSYSHVK